MVRTTAYERNDLRGTPVYMPSSSAGILLKAVVPCDNGLFAILGGL